MEHLTPKVIVAELDKYVIGQSEAKRAVAIALRNRWRRQQLAEDMRNEVMPKNIIMIGPTGVGKTEIARRLANLTGAPFLKVEASKYTEVGYHGRDVESMVRELVDRSLIMVRTRMLDEIREQAELLVEDRLIDALYEPHDSEEDEYDDDAEKRRRRTRERLRAMLRDGKFEERDIEISMTERPVVVGSVVAGGDEIGIDMQNFLEQMMPARSSAKRCSVAEARRIMLQEESEKLIDKEKAYSVAIETAENEGIIFVDELDKVAGRESAGRGPEVSREGVQRDLLPIVEGTTVATRYGMIRTDHILFIAAGAFHVAKPKDLIPELQGRFPIRVELDELTEDDFARILTEPQNALTKQYAALLSAEGVKLKFTDDGIKAIAKTAAEINARTMSIGARRLQTVMEKLLEDVSFDAPELAGHKITVDAERVRLKLEDILKDDDLTQYIL